MQTWTSPQRGGLQFHIYLQQNTRRVNSRDIRHSQNQVRQYWNPQLLTGCCRGRPYSTASRPPSASYLELRPSPNKGLGMFAAQIIPVHTLIVSDPALLSLGPSDDLPEAFQQYSNLPTEIKARFLHFHSFENTERDRVLAEKLANRGISAAEIPEMVRVSSIFTSNAFNVDDGAPGTLRRTMFPTISRINHSCVPNAHTNYNPRTGRMAVHSLSEIAKDDEISISYFNLLLPLGERKAKAAKWGFACQCPACDVNSGAKQTKHEARRARIREIEANLLRVTNDVNATEASVSRCTEQAEEMVRLTLEHDSLTPQLPIAYDYLATVQIVEYEFTRNGSLLESIDSNLQRALVAETNITGEDSPAAEKRRGKIQMFGDARRNIDSANATSPR